MQFLSQVLSLLGYFPFLLLASLEFGLKFIEFGQYCFIKFGLQLVNLLQFGLQGLIGKGKLGEFVQNFCPG